MRLLHPSLWASLLCAGQLMAQTLPYNPTRIFQSPNDSSLVYILEPSSAASPQGQLVAVNISRTLQASDVATSTLASSLPFLNAGSAGGLIAFTPAISRSGSIIVYAGSCTSSTSLWTYQPKNVSATGDRTGSWSQTSNTISSYEADVSGASFLSTSFIFSTLVDVNDAQRTTYIFGGMCPTSLGVNSSTWQGAAMYTNRMLKLTTPSTTSLQVSLSYSAWNKPIAEAGFTITGLTPTISNSSSGVVTQARSYVLVGGHTESAFINMSQVAVFSLPQETWSFQTVMNGNQGGTELALRSAISKAPDSRSGHTSVLSADGSAIIVFGGWVGDINTPANPQLAVLRLGSGFGGSADWAWDIPTTSGAGLQTGQGIYGHDAIMLPGNVMMIVGGTIIVPLSNKSRRSSNTVPRRSTNPLQTYFLNTTSLTWISQYTNPSYVASSSTSPTSTSPTSTSPSSSNSSSTYSSNNATKVGLGAGLSLGLAAVIGAIIVYFWYSRRLRRSSMSRRQRSLGSAASDTSIEGGTWWPGDNGGEMVQSQGLISHHGNMPIAAAFGDNDEYSGPYSIPAPGSNGGIPRKPINSRSARGYYQPTPSSNLGHGRNNSLGTPGAIHPIYEADEDMDIGDSPIDANAEYTAEVPSKAEASDPFIDPPRRSPLRSHPMRLPKDDAPQSPAQVREREVQEWVADWDAADAILNNAPRTRSSITGRVSPSKESGSGRTESNLSERSVASISAMGISRQSSINTRSNSLTAFFASNGGSWNPFYNPTSNNINNGTGDVSPISERSAKTTVPSHSPGSGSTSFTTAKTTLSFPAIRTEGETMVAQPQEFQQGSPSKSKPPRLQKRMNWLGSIKRALGGGHPKEGVSSNGSGSTTASPTRDKFLDHIPVDDDAEKRAEPRRTVSASATLWRRKQGRGDWEDSADQAAGQRSNTLTGHEMMVGEDDDEEEWDIEKAVRRRVVQVMFTVPKERLRVVNADDDGLDDERSEPGDGLVQVSEKQLEHKEQAMDPARLPYESELARLKGKGKQEISEASTESPEKIEPMVRRHISNKEESSIAKYAQEKPQSPFNRDVEEKDEFPASKYMEEDDTPVRRRDTRSPERVVRDIVLEKTRARPRSSGIGSSSPMGKVAEMVERMERGV